VKKYLHGIILKNESSILSLSELIFLEDAFTKKRSKKFKKDLNFENFAKLNDYTKFFAT